ncbi:cytochrome d ubiquinol oxidase subunit II [uncultured Psychrobacter sp.]|uniref:cytochrome d ubiquinol oxidase subunit II n=1 Tax=uncultured Psychrobacter sp. TaxID=259303 RepID=UPI00345A6BFA
MFNYGDVLDLPLIWGGLIAFSVFVYVLLDGFVLGCGILFPFTGSDEKRDLIMQSVAPFWDGNETWLVLGGGGLFAAFPVAYGVIMSGLYLPVIFMLFGLIMRGVAFELRFKSSKHRYVWNFFFAFGSNAAAFFQGMMLGTLIHGLEASNRLYTGGPFDWVSPFSIMCGFALIIGYALLGSTWLIIKTEHKLQVWARKVTNWMLSALIAAMVAVTVSMYFSDIKALEGWFSFPGLLYLAPMPIIVLLIFFLLRKDLNTEREYRPFILTVGLFLMGYIGVCLAIFPYIIPYQMTIYEAAAADTTLSFLLIGAGVMIPIILSYTAFGYYTFKGKTSSEDGY